MEFLLYRLMYTLRITTFLECLPIGFDLIFHIVRLAEFLADGLDLLTQIVIALDLVHLLAHLDVDLHLHAQDHEFACQDLVELLQASLDIDAGQEFLTCLQLEIQMAGDEVGQAAGIVDDGNGDKSFFRDLLRELDPLFKFMDYGARQCFHLHG